MQTDGGGQGNFFRLSRSRLFIRTYSTVQIYTVTNMYYMQHALAPPACFSWVDTVCTSASSAAGGALSPAAGNKCSRGGLQEHRCNL